MSAPVDVFVRRVHALALTSAVVLYATSPWIAMYRRLPREPSGFDWAHLAAGALAVLAGFGFAAATFRDGRWRLYFPWLSGRAGVVLSDVVGLVRGRLPASEGGGLSSALQGVTAVLFLLVALTGAGWWLAGGGDAALPLRSVHVVGADALAVLIVLHAVTALLHVIQMARG